MPKVQSSAAELAARIRKNLKEPKLRIAVYPSARGWYAKVYGGEPLLARDLQNRVDRMTRVLNEIYSLES
jgi:hypothetical protein